MEVCEHSMDEWLAGGNMMTERGVLWDMDGVLVDTGEFHFETWLQVLSEYRVHFSREIFKDIFGMNNFDILSHLLGEPPTPEQVDEIAGRKEEAFRQAIRGRMMPMPGVVQWLKRLSAWGVRQAIASSAPSVNIDILVDELGVRNRFDAIVSGNDLPGKPDPAVFLEAARRIGILPEKCVVIEDSVAGVEAAKRGGMKCIAVTTTSPAIGLSSADLVVDRLDSLYPEEFKRLLSSTEPRR